MDGLVAEELRALFDDRIVDEYRDVLRRPKVGFGSRDVDDLLDQLVSAGEQVSAPPMNVELPDLDDLPFLEVAVAGSADALVTGNVKHFPRKARSGTNVVTPRDLMEIWTRSSRSR